MYVRHTDEIEATEVTAGQGTSMQVLIAAEEGPNFAMRRFVMQPGGGMPNHTNQVEHEQYVLQGHAEIGIGDQVVEVKQGDAVLIPALIPHWYKNIGEESFVFLCLVPNKPDQVTLLD
ncbi:MAG: cupin domain-containing protein [Anaerolineales bacterium]|jgi:quercetin dioxygenase-like cupin family protein